MFAFIAGVLFGALIAEIVHCVITPPIDVDAMAKRIAQELFELEEQPAITPH